MKVSARNRLDGTVSAINPGPVNTEVALNLGGHDKLVAVVTSESAKQMGLAVGKRAIGLVKAPSVTIVTDAANYRFSARNQFAGEVTRVEKGALNSEIAIRLPGGTMISAVVTNEAVSELQLASGKPAPADSQRPPEADRTRGTMASHERLIAHRLYSEANQRPHATPHGAAEKGSEHPRMRATRRRIDGAGRRTARCTHSTENRPCTGADDHPDEHRMAIGAGCRDSLSRLSRIRACGCLERKPSDGARSSIANGVFRGEGSRLADETDQQQSDNQCAHA
jgi:molybdate transport system regulatory protein